MGFRVIGIDPGSIRAGFACIDVDRKFQVIEIGVIEAKGEYAQRLLKLSCEFVKLIERYHPQAVAIEKVFFAKNAMSALKLGQARGVFLLEAAKFKIPLFEYSATEVKAAIAGNGHASKEEVAKRTGLFCTGLDPKYKGFYDATDALALAIYHGLCIPKLLTHPKKAEIVNLG